MRVYRGPGWWDKSSGFVCNLEVYTREIILGVHKSDSEFLVCASSAYRMKGLAVLARYADDDGSSQSACGSERPASYNLNF